MFPPPLGFFSKIKSYKMSDSLFEGAPTREDRSEDVMGEQFVGHGVAWTSTAPLNFVLKTFLSKVFLG